MSPKRPADNLGSGRRFLGFFVTDAMALGAVADDLTGQYGQISMPRWRAFVR